MSMQTSLSAMSMSPSTGQGLAADARSLDALKLAANGHDPKAVREAVPTCSTSSSRCRSSAA